ncbi:MAG: winged helix-turn-helix transcriptional regulator [Candidatus Aenigmarchaeota archaeon]|nr:winged helix-turn-helix transcriptional regulator [Candidatus Aenigmarchaeota archaeon]
MPEDALREALINSMVHRNYLSNGRIQINIFYDRIEISNPGGLLFDKKELGKKSLARNPLLLDLAYRLDLVEKIGSGIARIKALCETNKTKVKFMPDSDWFTVVFERKIGTSKYFDETAHEITDKLHKIIEERKYETSSDWSKRLGDRLGDTQLKILFLIILDKSISITALAQKMKISTTAIEKNINTLKEKGFIKRIGSARSGHWEIVK